MTALPRQVLDYRRRRAVQGPWRLDGAAGDTFAGAVVIPSLAEGACLRQTLSSLARNPATERAQTLVIVVVNQREDASPDLAAANRADLDWLCRPDSCPELNLAWVDASSPGQALPRRHGGVGLARKIGLDLALDRLDWSGKPLLVCLDADTLVAPNYLAAIRRHFATNPAGAAALSFRHQPAEDSRHQAAIDRYELFIRSYALGLKTAGSPYAFTAVGSALACRADTYLRCDGMNRRQAGEDFYFLQQAVKTDGVATLGDTCVQPSARTSTRTPFGTGRKVAQQLDDGSPLLFYPVAVFQQLHDWLTLVRRSPCSNAGALTAGAERISPVFADFLSDNRFADTWQRLQRNHATPVLRLRAFHGWFDGLKTLRLVHQLCENGCSRQQPETAMQSLLAWSGLETGGSPSMQLERLRRHQADPALFSIGERG